MLLFHTDDAEQHGLPEGVSEFALRQSSPIVLKPVWMHVDKRPSCVREINEDAFAFQTRTEFNTHHTLNDNIFMLWRNILNSGAVNSKRILFSNFPFVTEGPPVQYWQLLPLLFYKIENIEDVFSFSQNSPVCFDNLYWGGANIPQTDAFVYTTLPSEKGTSMYPSWFLTRLKQKVHESLGIQDENDKVKVKRKKAILWLRPPSTDGRYFHPDSVTRIVNAFKSVQVETEILDVQIKDTSRHVFDPLRFSLSINTTLHKLHSADIIISIWGSSLANSAFMRHGTVLVDLLVSETYHSYHGPGVCCIFPAYAYLNKMIYVAGDVRRFESRNNGVLLPYKWALKMANEVTSKATEVPSKHEFSARGSPCSGQEEWKRFMGYTTWIHVIEP